MNRKILSIISAMALTASTTTALTSNGIAMQTKEFSEKLANYEKIEDYEDIVFIANEEYLYGVYIDTWENETDGKATICEVEKHPDTIQLRKTDEVGFDEIVEIVKDVNNELTVVDTDSEICNIRNIDENGEYGDLSITDVKKLHELLKDNAFSKIFYSPAYYSYSYCYYNSLLSFYNKDIEEIKKYAEKNNLNFKYEKPVEPELNYEQTKLIPEGEWTDMEYLKMMQKIRQDTGFYPQFLSPEKNEGAPSFTISNDFLNGDANKDEKLTLADSVAVLQSIANPDKYALSMEGEFNAEVDGEDGITVNDALIIRQWGLENTKG